MKRLLMAGFVALLCILFMQAALADQIWQFNCAADIYEQADLGSPKLAAAQAGQIYIINEASVESQWYSIQYQDMKTKQMVYGWLKNDQLAIPSTLTNPPDHYHPNAESWQLQSPADIYEAADMSAPVLFKAEAGQVYTVLDALSGTRWIQVAYTDMQSDEAVLGWLNEDLLGYGSLRYYGNAAPENSNGSVAEGSTATPVSSFKSAQTGDSVQDAISALRAVMRKKEPLSDAALAISYFAVMDLDGDSIPEIILRITMGDNDVGFEVMHYENGAVYSHELVYRSLMDLKTDGTFSYSSGAADSGFGKLRFEGNEYVIAEQPYYAAQHSKEDASWYEFTSDNVDTVLATYRYGT